MLHCPTQVRHHALNIIYQEYINIIYYIYIIYDIHIRIFISPYIICWVKSLGPVVR